ncbi:MAG: c-type cytochrome [Acidiferrobacteraceae bacterium]|nr:c-type cytochrome [Acidiferrobacteraceae bacterium]
MATPKFKVGAFQEASRGADKGGLPVLRQYLRLIVIFLTVLLGFMARPAFPAGDAEKGEEIYVQRCTLCHGEEGDGMGPAAERLNPPPRDFTMAQYKIRTTAFEEIVPVDSDLVRMIHDGMPSTAMPGWGDVLTEQDINDLVAFLKTLAGLEEEEPGQVIDYGVQVPISPESIETGRKLFHEDDRCSECHGQAGKGDAVKKLKDDSGYRTWPRNLTKPWTFRGSNDPGDIFTRITTGIAGTQMPSFDDPASDGRLSIEQRWNIANYVNSLAKTEKIVRPENTVIRATRVAGPVPVAPEDPQWQEAPSSTFLLVPQLIVADRFFTPSNDTITVRALYNQDEIGFHVEWDDRTQSIPGDRAAKKVSEPGLGEDAVAIQLPVKIPTGPEKPYFLHGDSRHPVNLWSWRSGSTTEDPSVALVTARGIADKIVRDASTVGLQGRGSYHEGTWQVVLRRPLTTVGSGEDLQFVEGAFIPVAFSAWDGSNGERGSAHTLTTWYWLLLKPEPGNKPWLFAGFAFVLILLLEIWWARTAVRRVRS